MKTEKELLTTLISDICNHIAKAAAIARASEVCAKEGYTGKAFSIALGIEQPLHDANNLLQAASVIKRRMKLEDEEED